MKIVKDTGKAIAITHGGTFHADEVMSTVILDLYRQAIGATELTVCRVNKYTPDMGVGDDVYVYDIGGGKWDHHQKGGNGSRANGIPYSSCGLIWRDLGIKICETKRATAEEALAIWSGIDKNLIQPIDAVDCGTMPTTEYPTQPLTFSGIISAFNPNWDDNLDVDCAFTKAVDYATKAFNVIYNRTVSKVKASGEVYRMIDAAKDERILVLDTYLPWVETLFNPTAEYSAKAAKILVGVYPAHRGGYQWRAMPDREGSYGMRCPAPIAWWGKSGEELQGVTGIKNANFCHPNGFIGGASTLEDTIAMAKLLVEHKDHI